MISPESDLKKLASEVLELDRRATPGPWDNRCDNTLDNMARPRHLWSEYGWVGEMCGRTHDNVPNAETIAHYRASAPKLAQALLVLVEAMEKISVVSPYDNLAKVIDDVDVALEAAERIVKEGE